MANYCAKFSKIIIIVSNLAILVAAGTCAVVLYKQVNIKEWIKLIQKNVPFIFLVVVAAFAIVVSIIGLFLLCCNNKCWKITYLCLILLVIILEIIVSVFAFLYPDNIISQIQENWGKPKFVDATNKFEKEFKCCGFLINNMTVPCGFINRTQNTDPCYQALKDAINENFKSLQIAVIILVVFEMILLACAMTLACTAEPGEGGITTFN